MIIKGKFKKNFLLKIFIIFIISVAFISALWFAIFYEVDNHKRNTINAFGMEQYLINNQLVDRVQLIFNDYMNNGKLSRPVSEEKIINEILKKETNSQNKYVFFYSTNGVLFEKDDSTTRKYKNKNLKQVFNLWEYNGGSNLDNIEQLINRGMSGTSEIIKNSETGEEIVSWCFFQAAGQKYIIGMSTTEDYLLKEISFNQHVMKIYIFGGIFTAMEIILSIVLSLHIFFTARETNKLENDIQNKNLQIQEFALKIDSMSADLQKISICDGLTGTYNRRFFYTILGRIDMDLFLPITIIKVKINGMKNVNDTLGTEKGDEVLVDVADILLKNCGNSNVVSRIDDNEFVLVLVDTDKKTAYDKVVDIKCQMEDNFIGFMCDISFGISTKVSQEENIFTILRDADIRMNPRGVNPGNDVNGNII